MSEELYFNDELRKCLNAAGLSDCGENDAWNYWYQRVYKAHNQTIDRVTEVQRAENAKLRDENAKLRELVARMAEALGIDCEWADPNWCKSPCVLEFECWPESDHTELRCPAWAIMHELGIEATA